MVVHSRATKPTSAGGKLVVPRVEPCCREGEHWYGQRSEQTPANRAPREAEHAQGAGDGRRRHGRAGERESEWAGDAVRDSEQDDRHA